MTRSERISAIIEQRQPLATRIKSAIGNLEILRDALGRIEAKRGELLQKVNEDEIKGKLNSLNFRTPHDTITEQLAVLEKLQARFSRETLNIGVIGIMRQGKSTLLQSLTGLGNNVIPAQSGGACTAVRSKIRHQTQGETRATVRYHSQESFLKDVIRPYYKDLGLNPMPVNLNDFIGRDLPILSSASKNTEQAIYNRLKDSYYANRHHYQNWLGQAEVEEKISLDKIQEYVTHPGNIETTDAYKCLAVKEVEIFCTFPNNDIEKITLVDIPGLGDFKSSDRTLMLETLGKEVDIVLLIRRPDIIGDDLQDKDTELYDKAAIAVDDLSERIFIVLNQLRDSEEAKLACQRFKQKLNEGRLGINFIDCIVADCSHPDEANQIILDKVLDYLSTKIRDLDIKIAKSCQEKLTTISQQIQSELEKGKNIFSQSADDDYQETEEIFTNLFGGNDQGWWYEVSLELQKLRSELWYQRQAPNEELYEGFVVALESCYQDKGILSADNAISKINDQLRIVGPFRAYPNYQDELRVLISHRFLTLDQSLQRTVETIKDKVAAVLKEQGLLSILSESSGSDFFDEIFKLIPERYGKLKESFEIIAQFRLSYRGLILPRMRQHLDGLTSITAMTGDQGDFAIQDEQTLVLSTNTTAEDIFSALEIDYDKAINRLKPALEELLCEPNEAAYAMVEEFIDNAIRQKGIPVEWRNFLRSIRGKLWPDVFGQQEQARQIRKDWLDSSLHVEKLTNSDLFLFI